MTLWFILGYFLLTSAIVYFSPRLILWTGAMIIYFALARLIYSDEINFILFSLLAIFSLIIAVVFNIKPIRILVTKIIFSKMKGMMPGISETEKLALDAGDAWYEKEIFQGKPSFSLLHNSKKFELSEEELQFLNHETEELCAMLDDWQINQDNDLPAEVWNFLREKGFFGLVISKNYGGKGFSAAAHSEIVMKIATRSPSAAVTVMVPNSLGPGELLHHYGTDEQKNFYLPRLAKGEDIPCFALTAPTAGSDATSIPDEGIVCYEEYNGSKTLGIKLKNINKRYITLAPVATVVGLAFQLKDPDNLLDGTGCTGITCALLPYDHPGLEIGNRTYPLKLAFMNGTVKAKEMFIPIDWIIGGQKMAGEGWRMLVECLSIGRSISLPACGTANGLFSTVMTSAYALVREQFKVPIGHFEGIEDVLAKMGGLSYMMNATRQFTVGCVDMGVKPAVASAISKYHLTENGRLTLNHAMDVHAGRAIIVGPNNYLASGYMASPVGITVEGANIMTRNLMIFGQGAMRCHPYIRKEYESLTSENGLEDFDEALFSHIGYLSQNKVRAIFHALTNALFAKGYNSKFSKYYKQITRMSSSFAYVSDIALLILGGELKRKERLSARLGDVMSYLYMACASLKYFKDNNERQSDEIFLTWVLEHCLFNAQNALIDVLDNFTIPAIGKSLKFILFPYGKPYKKPNDSLEHKIAGSLLNDCETRRAFKEMCYVPDDFSDCAGRMEVAFQSVLATHPIKAKITKAIKMKQIPKDSIANLIPIALKLEIITEEEAKQLNEANHYTNEVIQVDEFAPYELGPKNAHPNWQQA